MSMATLQTSKHMTYGMTHEMAEAITDPLSGWMGSR